MIAATLTGLSCAVVGFALPFTTVLALANAAPKTVDEARTFANVTIAWAITLLVTFFALAWLFGVAFHSLSTFTA